MQTTWVGIYILSLGLQFDTFYVLSDPGRVINIASVAGLDPVAEGTSLGESDHGLWSYNTSKAAAIVS